MPVRIPNNWEDKSPDDPVRAHVQAYIAAKDSGQFPYSAEPIHPLPTQTPMSNAPIYLGQWGPVTVLNPAPAYASAIHQPSSHTEPPTVGSAPGPAAASKDNKLKGKQKEKLNEKGTKEFEYQFMLNMMDLKKENETVYLPDSKSQSAQEVLDEILGRMKVELSVHQIGYRLSDEKECIFTRIHDVKDFAHAIEAQYDIQSRAYKSKKLRIINKDAVKKEFKCVAIKKRCTATASTVMQHSSTHQSIYEELWWFPHPEVAMICYPSISDTDAGQAQEASW
ncbi:uncharacterized protein EI90DRAFT_3174257 [Cantharellus anzutake]|uniref:uncharacterized protein n=1 Tax=Cantharellus anzutake TaxID=1750568 RepID=UPI001907FF3F|nr:uncharacterized protein EI90DRAFT_3174257 [Cantharellus anzutake]KAF8335367.1 hypothetical protein EI90DRAFT_3174257 [Cantharellus anzutake]